LFSKTATSIHGKALLKTKILPKPQKPQSIAKNISKASFLVFLQLKLIYYLFFINDRLFFCVSKINQL